MSGRLLDRRGAATAVAVLWLALPSAAIAQTQSGPPAPTSVTPKWEIEAVGGLSLGRWASAGTRLTQPAGPPIATSSPVFPSWRVPSWFFGDGATFLNNVAADLGVTNRIAPLDETFLSNALTDAGGVAAGLRVRRAVAPGYQAEFGLDVMLTRTRFASDMEGIVETARQSFVATMNELLATGPSTARSVSASTTTVDGASRELVLTGALVADARPFGSIVPYAVAGLGVVTQVGEKPSLTLVGNYRFTIQGTVPIDETDRATVSVSRKPAVAAVLGGGVRRNLSDRWGVRVDGRVLIGTTATRLTFSGTPQVATRTPAGYVETFTYPNLQFSNNASTGRVSTLSGSVEDFVASSGGIQTRARVTVGVFIRY